jgi:DNA-directed RNA polymerase beta subunit
MEKDVFCAHGTMRALFEKFYNDSDGIELPICRICGNRAVVNEKVGIYKCKYCGDDADIANVPSSWVASLFMQESSAMNVRLNFTLAPYEYTRMEE